jgi:hypothetical protein
MYPANFFNLFPAFPRENKVFVAMSFDPVFDKRWNEVIAPAIRLVEVGGVSLVPIRVDARRVSDSILTEILTGISRARIIFADITTIRRVNGRPFRNGNVMYEVGIAHAVRQPEEVLLFRSDNDDLLFDVANVRVNRYDPDNDPEGAIEMVGHSIVEALQEVQLQKSLAVKSTADRLDYKSLLILSQAGKQEGLSPPTTRTMREALGNMSLITSIIRLLEIGAISTSYQEISPELIESQKDQPSEIIMKYRITSFGRAVLEHAAKNIAPLLVKTLVRIEND